MTPDSWCSFLDSVFSTLQPNQFPDRDYMLLILAKNRYDQLQSMIQNAGKNLSTKAPYADYELIPISKKIYDEIKGIYTQKRKYLFWLKLRLVSKGKTAYLLKRSAKLSAHRKHPGF